MKNPTYTILKIVYLIVFTSFQLYGQVGINTNTPQALLDIKVANANAPANTDGLLVPRVNVLPTGTTYAQNAMIVFLTTKNNFYFWDAPISKWVPFIQKIDHLKDGKSDNDGTQDGSSVFLGRYAGNADDSTDNRNVGVGYRSLQSNDDGERNTAVGYEALQTNENGSDNTAFGYGTLRLNTGSFNTAVGSSTLSKNTTGSSNTAFGNQALLYNTTGNNNVVFGDQAAIRTTSSNNTVFGGYAYSNNINGVNNTIFGNRAGDRNEGSNNVIIGDRANTSSGYMNGSNNIMIGARVAYNKNVSDKLYIDNSTTPNPLIGGDFVANRVGINKNPLSLTHTLTVGGNVKATNYTATVGPGGYADYVFEKYYTGNSKINDTYKLLSLKEAEEFTKKYHHLPGVKSYAEIKANNFEFGMDELSLKNLEKTEELFIYITQLNKKTQQQKKEIKTLKTLLEKQKKMIDLLIKKNK